MSLLKMIVDAPGQNKFGSLDVIAEGVERSSDGSIDSIKAVTFSGPYMVAETLNRNGRKYVLSEMMANVNRYQTLINEGRALGELEHPESPIVNLKEACHQVSKMWMEGNTAMGSSKVLMSQPNGRIIGGLMAEGVKLGTSSRGLGELAEGVSEPTVVNFHYVCNDVVHDPSAPGAFVEGVLANKAYVIGQGGVIVESAMDKFEDSLNTLPVKQADKDKHLAESYFKLINRLRDAK
jgi:hypothetical protein